MERLEGRTLLVTGGAGFIGSAFVRSALGAGAARIVVLDKLSYAGNLENLALVAADPRLSFVRGDIGDEAGVGDVLRALRPDAIVNFAAESHVDNSIAGPAAFVENNIVAVFHLLEAARRYAGEGFRFVQVSTDEVYGPIGKGSADEDAPLRPSSPYSASKAASDGLVAAWHTTYGLQTLLTRGSNTYGPRQFPEKLIPVLVRNGLRGEPLPIYGDGRYVRDWLYVDDHAAAVAAVLTRGTAGRTYNVAGGEERTNLEILDAVCERLDQLKGGSHRALARSVPDRPGHDRRYAVDTTRIRTELGWAPRWELAHGLSETVRWYVENPGWSERVASGAYRAVTELEVQRG